MSEIQLRQTYRDKVYNYRPSWILRWGISLFFAILLLILVAMGFIKYPDIVPATAEITTINPPANIIARINGKIDSIFVNNGKNVSKNQALALLQSVAYLPDIKIVETQIKTLDSIQKENNYTMLPKPAFLNNNLSLGEVQSNYAELKINYTALYNYLYSGLYNEQNIALKNKIAAQKKLVTQLKNKREILKKQYQLIKKEFKRDSVIHSIQGISDNQYEKQYNNLLQAKTSIIDMDINIENTSAYIIQLQSEINKTKFQYKSDSKSLADKFTQTVKLLKSQVEMWKQNHLIVSPIDGVVSFTTFWSKNQNVQAGEVVFTIVPTDTSTIKVRIQFPVQNSGKVECGQRVNIKLFNYPYQEFGMLVGYIDKISEVPNNDLYSADVILNNKLITSYKKTIPKVQNLKGEAEILTDDISLLLRLFNPIRALFDDKIRVNKS